MADLYKMRVTVRIFGRFTILTVIILTLKNERFTIKKGLEQKTVLSEEEKKN